MTITLLGTGNSIMTVGMAHCEEAGESMPFFACGPSDPILKEIGTGSEETLIEDAERIERTVASFARHGSVVFFDTQEAASCAMRLIMGLMSVAVETEWAVREPKPRTIN